MGPMLMCCRKLAATLGFGVLLVGCDADSDPDGGNSTLRDYTGLDGCGWVIEVDEGDVLEPMNLGEFIDNPASDMRLLIEYTEESGYASICMVGPIVRLTACGVVD